MFRVIRRREGHGLSECETVGLPVGVKRLLVIDAFEGSFRMVPRIDLHDLLCMGRAGPDLPYSGHAPPPTCFVEAVKPASRSYSPDLERLILRLCQKRA